LTGGVGMRLIVGNVCLSDRRALPGMLRHQP
jgi:hypothetical protein